MEFKRRYHEMFTDYVAARPFTTSSWTSKSTTPAGQRSDWDLKRCPTSRGPIEVGVENPINTSEVNTWVPLVRVPDVAQEQVVGQDAAPRARAVPVGRAAAGRAPVEEVLGGRAPVGPGPREQEPGPREPERAAPVVPGRSAAVVALAVSVSLGGFAVPIPAPVLPPKSRLRVGHWRKSSG